MRAIDFGFQLRQVDQVECGFNHFIVRTEGKVFAWGCYNTDSEEHMLWSPTELPFFTQYKIKAIRSGNQQTVALVE
jgi:alpha-tubulin suppressor-like RCC1 family protein